MKITYKHIQSFIQKIKKVLNTQQKSIMKTLQLEETKARDLYKTAAPEFKTILEDTFGKDFFSQKIEDIVKSIQDAITYLGEGDEEVVLYRKMEKAGMPKHYLAEQRCIIFCRAMNEKKSLNSTTYTPYFDRDKTPGSGFFGDGSAWYRGLGDAVSSRLHFNTSAHATHAGKVLEQDYYDYIMK